jgi:hypothetical protein
VKRRVSVLLIFVAFSCEKEEKEYCWECISTTSYGHILPTMPGVKPSKLPATTKSTIQVCEISEKDISKTEQLGNSTTESGNIRVTVKTKCNKK